ncbi:hypothetical protein CPJ18_01965 [Agrobacterium rosae]|uniref:Uncharacterized protein n=1 Tax=Agrobacterium rosae TaxID=1972867 RepID=A0AAE5S1P1_9HYPH|nr:hypothetical protein [Agrobacterium rosae]POO54294.1 hypothetical protein CPJ18_01965 [Agrobacterium rosae]
MSNTPNLNIPMPDPSADVDDEFYRLQQAWMLVDAALYQLIVAVAGKSNAGHTHAIDQINGLVSALQNKMDASKTFKIGDLTDVVGAADAQLNYVLSKNIDGKFTFASALSLLGNHEHTIAQVQGLTDALNARLSKSGGIMSNYPVLGFDYAQLWFGYGATGTGWRVIKDTAEGSVGNLVFQWSNDRWNNSYNTVMYMAPDGQVRFNNKLQALGGMDALGPVNVASELYVKGAVEVGGMTGQAGFAVVDFHTSAAVRDYNCRIICDSNANDGNGLGTMNILAGNFMWNGNRLISMWDKATAGDIKNGVADKFPDAAAVKAALAPFTSGQQTITMGSTVSVAHGLGVIPSIVQFDLICVTAELGWAAGQVTQVPSGIIGVSSVTPGGYGVGMEKTSTNIIARFPYSAIQVPDKAQNSGASGNITPANWRLIVRASP